MTENNSNVVLLDKIERIADNLWIAHQYLDRNLYAEELALYNSNVPFEEWNDRWEHVHYFSVRLGDHLKELHALIKNASTERQQTLSDRQHPA
jgi:hypothetical protein